MSDLKERVARALASQAYSAGGMERIIDPYTPDAEYWQGQADAAIDLVLEEAARCAEGPPRRVSASGEVIYRGDEFYEYETDGSSDYGAGRMDAAAVIRALKEKQ